MSILARIRAHGGEVIREEWRVSLRKGRLSGDALAWISNNRDALMEEIIPFYGEWEERAAIREFDGEQDRDTAEREAWREFVPC